MTGKEIKNVTASVLARLRNTAKSGGAPFQQVLQLYAIERFLYRISKSQHAQSVILKGALLLKTLGVPRVSSATGKLPENSQEITQTCHQWKTLYIEAFPSRTAVHLSTAASPSHPCWTGRMISRSFAVSTT